MRIVVVGSGLAGVTLAEALAAQPGNAVTLVTAELHGYYSRPRLSHGVALTDEAAAKIVMKPFGAFAPGLRVLSGIEVQSIDRDARHALLSDGKRLAYDALVLATGSAARIPPALAPSRPNFLTLNSYDDLLTLRRRRRKVLERGASAGQSRGERPRWAVIGGGLIGCELASDLHKAGDAVTIFHREPRLLELQLDAQQSAALHRHFVQHGVEVRYDQDVRAVAPNIVVTAAGDCGPFDGIVVSTGFAPRVELARQAGLTTARGVAVDSRLSTSDPAVFAAGDVAQLGERLFPFVSPIRSQALWLAQYIGGLTDEPWAVPAFAPVIKIHDFKIQSTGRAASPSGT
jgi:NAD(P)H-nitrite reductase large subunit